MQRVCHITINKVVPGLFRFAYFIPKFFSAIIPNAEERIDYGVGAASKSKLSLKSALNFAVGPMTVPKSW